MSRTTQLVPEKLNFGNYLYSWKQHANTHLVKPVPILTLIMLLDTASLESMSPTRMQKTETWSFWRVVGFADNVLVKLGVKLNKLGTFILHETF